MIFLELFVTFFMIGAFTFGGGYAMLPLVQEEVLAKGWMELSEIVNFIAISESTPGVFAVNMATYVGSEMGGLFGAICATLGVVMPSFIIILIVAAILNSFRNNTYVNRAFYGLRPASTGLIAGAGISVILSNLFYAENGISLAAVNWKGWILAAILWFLTNKVKKTL